MQCQQCIWKMNKGITGMSGYSSAWSLPATWQSCYDMPTSQLHTRGQALASCVSSCLGVKSTPEVISSCATRPYFPQRKQSAKHDQNFHVSQRLWTHGWSRRHMLEQLLLIKQKSGHLLDGLNTGNTAFQVFRGEYAVTLWTSHSYNHWKCFICSLNPDKGQQR